MQLIKKTKKGFTLVELIVVIAIVAILAAVSVVSYIAFINSANESADLQLVKQINLCMEASEALHGKNGNMQQALDTAFENGFVIENLTPRSNKDIVWNSETNRFELLDKAPASHPEIMFKIYNSVAEMVDGQASEGYSVYLNNKEEDFHAALEQKTGSNIFVSKTGFDAGDNQTIIKMKYKNTGDKQTVIFRTNSGDLIVDGPQDTVKHYGVGRILTIEQVGPTDCYHEYGVFGEAAIAEGKLVVQNSGFIGSVKSTGTNENVTIENNGTIMDASGASQIDITGNGNLESDVIEVSTFDQFQGLAYACNLGRSFKDITIKLMADIDMTGKVWVPFGQYVERKMDITVDGRYRYMPVLDKIKFFEGNIDGNGKKIINLSNRGYKTEYTHSSVLGTVGCNYGLIAIGTGNIKISNLDISFDIVKEGQQSISCFGIIGQYYGIEKDPIAKHYYDTASEQWKVKYNERYDNVNKTYNLLSTTVEFNKVKTSGNIEVEDAGSAYVGTTYVSQQIYNFDGRGIYRYSNDKTHLSGPVIGEKKLCNETDYESLALAADGYYFENFVLANIDSNKQPSEPEVKCYVNGNLRANVATEKEASTFAPLNMTFNFIDCENSANVYAKERAAIYFGKFSNSLDIDDILNFSFIRSTNSANVYSEGTSSGIFTGNFNNKIANGTYLEGLTNSDTVTVTRNYKTNPDAAMRWTNKDN